jgi:hypothetical protein
MGRSVGVEREEMDLKSFSANQPSGKAKAVAMFTSALNDCSTMRDEKERMR